MISLWSNSGDASALALKACLPKNETTQISAAGQAIYNASSGETAERGGGDDGANCQDRE